MKSIKQVAFGVLPLIIVLCGPVLAGPRLFVPNYGQGTVSVFDQAYLAQGEGQQEVDTNNAPGFNRIIVGTNPTKVAVTPDARWGFCTNSGSNTVSWFTARSDSSGNYNSITNISVGTTPKDAVIAENTTTGAYRVVVANTGDTRVTVIDPNENGTASTTFINVIGAGSVAANPKAIAYSANLPGLVYVATKNANGATVASFYTTTLPTQIGPGPITLPADHDPLALALSPDASQIWILTTKYVTVYRRSDNVQLLDTRLPIDLTGGGLALNGKVALLGKGNKAYVSLSNGTEGHVYAFYTSPPSYKGNADVGGTCQGLDVAPDDSAVWVANGGTDGSNNNNLSVLDGVSDQPLVDTNNQPIRITGASGYPLVRPWSVTFVPEDTRKFNGATSYLSQEQWPMFAGGGLRTGLALSPIQEIMSNRGTSPGSTGTPAWSVNVNGQPWTEMTHTIFGREAPIPLSSSPVSANYAAPSDTVILTTYRGTSSNTIYAYATTGNGAGSPVLRWSSTITGMGTTDGFVATPVIVNSGDYHWYQNMQYAVAVSLTGRVYSLAVHGAIYYLGSNPYFSAGSTIWWGRIPNITVNSVTATPFVVSSPVRYGSWLYVAVVWKNASGTALDCGLVRISAEPTYFEPQYNVFSGTIQIYYRITQDQSVQNPLRSATSFWTAVYGSPAVSPSVVGGNPGVVFTVRTPTGGADSPEDTGDHGYVYRVPIQSATNPAATWVTDLPSNGWGDPTFNEVGSPSVAYGKVFVSVYGNNTYVTYAIDAISGAVIWHSQTMTLGACGSLHPPAVYDGNVLVASDDTGGIESILAESFDTAISNPQWNGTAGVDGYAAFTSPAVTTSETLLYRPYGPASGYNARNLWGIDTEFGPSLSAPPTRLRQSLGLGAATSFNTSPAVVYVSGTGITAGRWTFVVSDSGDPSYPEKLQAVLKGFTW